MGQYQYDVLMGLEIFNQSARTPQTMLPFLRYSFAHIYQKICLFSAQAILSDLNRYIRKVPTAKIRTNSHLFLGWQLEKTTLDLVS